jgi:glutathione S-transferase
MSSPPVPTLGYWKIRGLAQPTRTLFRYLNVAYTDVLYEQGDGPDFSRDTWLSVKPSIPADFSNLPYLIDGTTVLTQSQTILRYVARKYGSGSGLYEGSAETLATIDLMMDQTIDLRSATTAAGYRTSYAAFKESLPSLLSGFEAVLKKDGRSFIAGGLTIADFTLNEVLEQIVIAVHELFAGEDILAAFPLLKAYKARFEGLPAIAAFRASADFLSRPFNNKSAANFK